ncbi:IS66 family insertion sequence element accessory protein TnpA [Litoribacillus peritrichatus]
MQAGNSHESRKSFWCGHIENWLQNENCSQQAYCLKNGLSESSFSRWKSKIKPKLRRGKTVSKTEKYWRFEVDNWIKDARRSKKDRLSFSSQSYYCLTAACSESSFSRWKNKFYPELKNKRQKRNENFDMRLNRLSKKSFKALVSGFVDQESPKQIALNMGISLKTCYKYLKIVESKFVLGAIEYPALFNGAGILLFFGPPPNIHESLLENYKKRGRKPSKKTFSKILKNSILYNSLYDWTSDEIWFFYMHGWMLFFERIYKKENGVEGGFSEKHRRYIRAENHESDLIGKLWDDYIQSGFDELLTVETWHATYHTHKHKNLELHRRQMIFDLSWVLKNQHPIKRSIYWDENFPKPCENVMTVVSDRINNSFNLLFGG